VSNGIPEPFEDKAGKPLGVPATLAIWYAVLWTVAALAHWIVPFRFPFGIGWARWISVALLALSLATILAGFGAFDRLRGRRD
jgi:hypothetical protein